MRSQQTTQLVRVDVCKHWTHLQERRGVDKLKEADVVSGGHRLHTHRRRAGEDTINNLGIATQMRTLAPWSRLERA